MPPRKGQSSRTHKGKKDFLTHKGDTVYHRKGHDVRIMPYQKKGGFAFLPALFAGMLSGGVSFGTQKLLKKLGLGKRRPRKH